MNCMILRGNRNAFPPCLRSLQMHRSNGPGVLFLIGIASIFRGLFQLIWKKWLPNWFSSFLPGGSVVTWCSVSSVSHDHYGWQHRSPLSALCDNPWNMHFTNQSAEKKIILNRKTFFGWEFLKRVYRFSIYFHHRSLVELAADAAASSNPWDSWIPIAMSRSNSSRLE